MFVVLDFDLSIEWFVKSHKKCLQAYKTEKIEK